MDVSLFFSLFFLFFTRQHLALRSLSPITDRVTLTLTSVLSVTRSTGPYNERTNNTERKHTSEAPSSQQRQEALNAHRSGGNKATHTAPNSPECNQMKA